MSGYDAFIILSGGHSEVAAQFRAAWREFEQVLSARCPTLLVQDALLTHPVLTVIRRMSAPAYLFPIVGYDIYEWGGKFYRRATGEPLPARAQSTCRVENDARLVGGGGVAHRIGAREIYRWGLMRQPPEFSYAATGNRSAFIATRILEWEAPEPLRPGWISTSGSSGDDRVVAHIRNESSPLHPAAWSSQRTRLGLRQRLRRWF